MSLGPFSMFAIRNVDLLTLNGLSKHCSLRETEVQNTEGYDSYGGAILRPRKLHIFWWPAVLRMVIRAGDNQCLQGLA